MGYFPMTVQCHPCALWAAPETSCPMKFINRPKIVQGINTNHPNIGIYTLGWLINIYTNHPNFQGSSKNCHVFATEHCEGRAEQQQPRGGQGPGDQLPSQSIADQKLPKHPISLGIQGIICGQYSNQTK